MRTLQPVDGGIVSVNSGRTTKGVGGYFEIYVPLAQRYVIRANGSGHAPYSRTHIGQGLAQMDIRLLAAETFTVDRRVTLNVVDIQDEQLIGDVTAVNAAGQRGLNDIQAKQLVTA